jgi:hypothetical protein
MPTQIRVGRRLPTGRNSRMIQLEASNAGDKFEVLNMYDKAADARERFPNPKYAYRRWVQTVRLLRNSRSDALKNVQQSIYTKTLVGTNIIQ